MPHVSVVIPLYNHEQFIAEAVESVLTQTVTDLELIVVDDGSTDNSLDIVQGFTDRRLKVLSQSNQGAHAAINRGLREATGTYLAILNSDDMYLPTRLEKLTSILETDPQIGLAASYIEVVDKDGKPLGIKHSYRDLEPWLLEKPERSFRAGLDPEEALLTENFLATTSNYVFSRKWYERIGEFRKLKYAHDWDFALRVTHHARLALHPEPLMKYRVHTTNTIREDQVTMIFEICWCLAVHLPRFLEHREFLRLPLAKRIDQLLHSIYTYECDRVLSVMLLQEIAHNPDTAVSLLDTDNPSRSQYINYIHDRLKKGEAVQELSILNPQQPLRVTQSSWIRDVLSLLRNRF
jgi:glycosyltransferase involved in cell wall biosynthesis